MSDASRTQLKQGKRAPGVAGRRPPPFRAASR